jgi:hypothetical protein
MFSAVSKGGAGFYILLIEFVFKNVLGMELPEGSVASAVDAIYTIVGFVLMAWSLFTRTDLYLGLIRKK